MKTVFAYIRVSTQKQGREGASLPEQKDSIERYCIRNNLSILRWFEEEETAAKTGRKLFSEMMKLLQKRKADGVVFHKIDRSTRNLFEWAEVSSLPEKGIDVHYSHEPVDLVSSHGRTAADVAAVFAASFIRNLREEVKKGQTGRLKQGLYPFKAPLGYLDSGRGKRKEIDPDKGPLVRKLFEIYATGESSFHGLLVYAKRIGLVGMRGTPLTLNGVSSILKNPFYMGLIHVKKRGETFAGAHEPLVTPVLVKRARAVVEGRLVPRTSGPKHLFQRLLTCTACGRSLIAERQKGFIYYRCHLCKGSCLREEAIEETIKTSLTTLQLTMEEQEALLHDLKTMSSKNGEVRAVTLRSLTLQIDALNTRLAKLTDGLLDGLIGREEYEKRKLALMRERSEKESERDRLKENSGLQDKELTKKLELIISLPHNYFSADFEKKRQLLKILTSNFSVSQKSLVMQWKEPFQTLLKRGSFTECEHDRGHTRTICKCKEIAKKDFETDLAIKIIQFAQSNEFILFDHYLNPPIAPLPPFFPRKDNL